MFFFFKFIVLLSFNGSLASKCMSLNNEKYEVRPTLIDLTTFELKCYDKCNGGCNTLKEISGIISVQNKAENVNLNVFDLITRTNE